MTNVYPASTEALQTIVAERQWRTLTWPNGEEAEVDLQTAQVLLKVREALNESAQAKFDERISTSRAWFLTIVDFAWDSVVPPSV